MQVSGPAQIPANKRTVIKSPQPLQTANYWTAVCLLPAAPSKLAALPQYGFVNADGKAFMPKVLARNADGTEDSLPIHGNLGSAEGTWLCLQPLPAADRRHPPYVDIVIESTDAMSLKSVLWHSVDKKN